MSRANNFVDEVQSASRQLWDSINKLTQLQREWTFRDYTNTLEADITLTEYPPVADLAAMVNTTVPELNSVMAAGHGTNLTKVL
jgi:hypothetical protein